MINLPNGRRGLMGPSLVSVLIGVAILGGFTRQSLAAQYLSTPPGKRILLLIGSNTLGEQAIPELAQAYLKGEKKASGVTEQRMGDLIYVSGTLPDGSAVYIEIHATGSGDCFRSFLGQFTDADKTCDIGMSSRRVTREEEAAIKEKTGSDFFSEADDGWEGCEHPVGMDGVAVVVQKDVPVSRLSFTELQGIYSRTLIDWSQTDEGKQAGLSGTGRPIFPIRRKEPSGTLDFFKERVKPDPGPMSDESVIPAFTSSGDLVAKVAATPGGIGFVGQGYAFSPGVKRVQLYNDMPPQLNKPDEASFPDTVAVQQEFYPLARVVYLYTPVLNVNPDVDPFIKFALSEDGQAVIAASGNLMKIEGTVHQAAMESGDATAASTANPVPTAAPNDGREKKIILRLEGSNTVGAECALNLAYDFLMSKRQNPSAQIEDKAIELETPEGEKAKVHDLMCDLNGDGVIETIEIRPTGSGDAFRGLATGDCDVGMSSRPISEGEKRDLLPVCGNLSVPEAQFALGLDALAVVVSNANALEKITVEQLRSVFLGEIRDWAKLGGAPGDIHLHSRADRSGTYKYFCDSILLGMPVAARRKAPRGKRAARGGGGGGHGRNRVCSDVGHRHGEGAECGTGGIGQFLQADGGDSARGPLSAGALPLRLSLCAGRPPKSPSVAARKTGRPRGNSRSAARHGAGRRSSRIAVSSPTRR